MWVSWRPASCGLRGSRGFVAHVAGFVVVGFVVVGFDVLGFDVVGFVVLGFVAVGFVVVASLWWASLWWAAAVWCGGLRCGGLLLFGVHGSHGCPRPPHERAEHWQRWRWEHTIAIPAFVMLQSDCAWHVPACVASDVKIAVSEMWRLITSHLPRQTA